MGKVEVDGGTKSNRRDVEVPLETAPDLFESEVKVDRQFWTRSGDWEDFESEKSFTRITSPFSEGNVGFWVWVEILSDSCLSRCRWTTRGLHRPEVYPIGLLILEVSGLRIKSFKGTGSNLPVVGSTEKFHRTCYLDIFPGCTSLLVRRNGFTFREKDVVP